MNKSQKKQLRHLVHNSRFRRNGSPSLRSKVGIAVRRIEAASGWWAAKCGRYSVKTNVLPTLWLLDKFLVVIKISRSTLFLPLLLTIGSNWEQKQQSQLRLTSSCAATTELNCFQGWMRDTPQNLSDTRRIHKHVHQQDNVDANSFSHKFLTDCVEWAVAEVSSS